MNMLYVPRRTQTKLVTWILTIPHQTKVDPIELRQLPGEGGKIIGNPACPTKKGLVRWTHIFQYVFKHDSKKKGIIVRNWFFLKVHLLQICSTENFQPFKQVVLFYSVFLAVFKTKIPQSFPAFFLRYFMKPRALCRLLGVLQPFNP